MKSSFGVQFSAARPRQQLIPLLVDDLNDRITITLRIQFARNIAEMLLVLGPAQPRGELQIGQEAIISFTKCRVRIQRVGILAEKIIVAVTVELGTSGLKSI